MQGVRRSEHLPAPALKEPVQGVRGCKHLPAPAAEEQMQGVRGREHLQAPAAEEQMQALLLGVPYGIAWSPVVPSRAVCTRIYLGTDAHEQSKTGAPD